MSIEILNEVWNYSPASGVDRLVLLSLADQANPVTRECWPSIGYIAKRCRVSERTVQRSIRSLEKLGEIVVIASRGWHGVEGRGRTNVYRIVVYLPAEDGCQSGTPDSLTPSDSRGTGDKGDGGPVTRVSPEPLLNHEGISFLSRELARECGWNPEKLTDPEQRELATAAQTLHSAGRSVDDVRLAGKTARATWTAGRLTPKALVRNFSTLVSDNSVVVFTAAQHAGIAAANRGEDWDTFINTTALEFGAEQEEVIRAYRCRVDELDGKVLEPF
ncbi:MAG: helix-turn-helix domain-containing protein [Acidimicrobiales bacterium]